MRLGLASLKLGNRGERLAASFASSLLAKVLALGVSLLLVKLCIGYLGSSRFGILMAVLSLPAFLSFLDLGIPNATMNRLSGIDGQDGREQREQVQNSSFLLLSAIALLECAGFLVLSEVVDFSRFFSIRAERGEFDLAMRIFVLMVLAAQPFAIAQKVRLSRQQAWINSGWEIAGSLISLVAVLVVTRLQAGVPALAAAMASGLLLGQLGNFLGCWFFGPERNTGTGGWSRDIALRLASPSLGFLTLQGCAAVAFGFDGFIVLKALGAEAVGDFSVHQRLFQVVPVLAGFLFLPLWPMYAQAAAKGDREWLRRTFLRVALGSAVVGTIACLVMVPVTAAFIPVWSDGLVVVDGPLLWWLSAWSLYMLVSSGTSILLNALGKIWIQVALSLLMVAATLVGKALALAPMGLEMIPLVNLLANLAIVYLPTTAYAWWLLRRTA